ncbi:monooxygenase [Sphingobium sp. MI1205]|nr:monooxygenase [Sphingobium sp. MI1205]
MRDRGALGTPRIRPDRRRHGAGPASDGNDIIVTASKLGSLDRPPVAASEVSAEADYPPYGNRPVIDNSWLEAIRRDDVRLLSDGIECFDESGIITLKGENVPVDIAIFATGFQPNDYSHRSRQAAGTASTSTMCGPLTRPGPIAAARRAHGYAVRRARLAHLGWVAAPSS